MQAITNDTMLRTGRTSGSGISQTRRRAGVAPIATRAARSRYRAGTCKANWGSDLRSVFQRAIGRSIAERTAARRSPGGKITCRCVNSRASSCAKIEASTQRGIRIDRVVFLLGYHQIRVYSVFKSEQVLYEFESYDAGMLPFYLSPGGDRPDCARSE